MIQYDDRFKALGVDPNDVFEVHPHNVTFLLGKIEKPKFLKQLTKFWVIFTFGCVTTIDTIVLLLIFTLPTITAQFGTLTFAELTQPCSDVVKSICSVEYKYALDGKFVQGSQGVTADIFLQTYPEQKRIEVKYLPFLPQHSVIVYPEFGNGLDQSIFITVFFNICTILCGLRRPF